MGRNLILSVIIYALFPAVGDAQILGRRARGNAQPPTYTLPSSSAAIVSSNCPCGPGSSKCDDYCVNPPRIIPNDLDCQPETNCVDIPYKILPPAPPICINIPFYGPPQKFPGEVEVPVLVEICKEEIKFKTIRIPYPCCTVEVCIPCEKCFTKTKDCKKQKMKVDLEAYRRQDGAIDVYGQNVPGLPTKFVQAQKLSVDDYKKMFPSAPVPDKPSPTKPCE